MPVPAVIGPKLALAIGSTVASAGVSVIQGLQASRTANYNAKVLAADAEARSRQARFDEARRRRELRRIIGEQRAAAGASGVAIGTGSALLIEAENAAQAEIEALNTRLFGETEASRLRSEAEAKRSEARAAKFAGFAGAGTSLLTGASNIAERFG